MKKVTLFILASFLGSLLLVQAQDIDPNGGKLLPFQNSKMAWQLQFQHTVNESPTAGIECDGSFFYATIWNANKFYKYNLLGTLVDSFSISGGSFPTSGTSFIRDLAYDGTYFYGGNAGTTIYKMDFATHTCVGTITCPTGTVVRHIAYDPATDGGNGGFWVGDWSSDIKLISRAGAVLNTIPAANIGTMSLYGSALDTSTANGGPYLWLYSQTTNGNDLIQVKVATKTPTDLVYDITKDISVAEGSIAGGLFIQADIVSGTTTLGGLIQNQKIWGYNFTSTIPTDNDVKLTLMLPQYTGTSTQTQIKGVIQNVGANVVTNVKINYSINGGAPVSHTYTGLSISPYGTYNFTHPTAWTPSSVGINTVKVWTSDPNGSTDSSPQDDTTSQEVLVVTQLVQRLPLHEAFTSSTCSPCYNGNVVLSNILNANPNKWSCVKYQMSWPSTGDPYYTTEGGTRRSFYGVNSVPFLMVDGGFNANTSTYTNSAFNAFYQNPAILGIAATHTVIGHTVDVNVTLTPYFDYPSSAFSDLRYFIAIVENKTVNNVKTNGETEFHYVMKKLLPSANGSTVGTFSAGTPVMINKSHEFKGNYRLPSNASDPINHAIEHSIEQFTDLSVVVWVQDMTTKEVLQSTWSTFTSGINENANNEGIVTLHPNPANGVAMLRCLVSENAKANISVYNMIGKAVFAKDLGSLNAGYHTLDVNLDNINAGIYLVKLTLGEKSYTQKLIVK